MSKYSGKSLDKVRSSEDSFDQVIYKIAISGLTGDPEKPFREKSLSRFYYEIYGFGINENKAKELLLELIYEIIY